MGIFQNRDGVFDATKKYDRHMLDDPGGEVERSEFDISRYTCRVLMTHAYGMTDRNFCLLAGMIMSLITFPIVMGIPQQGTEKFAANLYSQLTLIVVITLVVISIHSQRALWLRMLMLVSSSVCPLFATVLSSAPYKSRFIAGFVLIMTPLTGYAVREWLALCLWSLVIWLSAVLYELFQGWSIGFYQFYLNRSFEDIYAGSEYAYSPSVEHNRDQFLCIMSFATMEFIAMSFVSFSVVMFTKAESFAALYLLCMKPQTILDLTIGSYQDQEEVIPSLIALHFVTEVKNLLESNSLNYSYFTKTLKDVISETSHMRSIQIDDSNHSSVESISIQDHNPDVTDGTSELPTNERLNRDPFEEEVMTFVKNQIASPPSFPLGPFISRTIQHNYIEWIAHIYIPTTWTFYNPFVHFLIFGCLIDACKNVITYYLLIILFKNNYVEQQYSTSSENLTPIMGLAEMLLALQVAFCISVVGAALIILIATICIVSSCRSLIVQVSNNTRLFLQYYLCFSLAMTGVHQYLNISYLDRTITTEIALTFTDDSFFWVLLIALTPFQPSTTHLSYVARFLPFIVVRLILIGTITGSQAGSSILLCLSLITIPGLKNMTEFRRHIFSATISSRISVSDNLYRGLAWSLNLEQEAEQKDETVVLPMAEESTKNSISQRSESFSDRYTYWQLPSNPIGTRPGGAMAWARCDSSALVDNHKPTKSDRRRRKTRKKTKNVAPDASAAIATDDYIMEAQSDNDKEQAPYR